MEFLRELFLGIVNMSITASVVIAVVLILRLLLSRAPKGYSYLLWGIVLFRLLCPVSLSSGFSALDLTEGRTTEQGRIEYFTRQQPQEVTAVAFSMASGEEESSQEAVRATLSFQQDMLPLLALAWLAGILVLAACSGVALLRLRRKTACSINLRENIYLADHIPTPFVLGLLRPRIYLPSGLGEQEREYILFHEQYHIRRKDYLVKPLAFLALCLHWFNPLVWLAFILAGRDMEMSCDEAVMRKMGGDVRKEYASLLLRLSTEKRMIAGTPLAFGEDSPGKRIRHVMGYKKPAVFLGVAAGILLIVAAVCLLTNPVSERASMKWAQELKAGEVAYVELMVLPQDPERQYRYFSENEAALIVELVRESRGRYLAEHEEGDGGSIFFYFTMKDGTTHEVGNIGNTYLFIDGDYYDASYDWLSGWDAAYGAGNDRLPPGFLDGSEDRASVEFQARVLEITGETMLVEPVEGAAELDSADRFSIPQRHMSPSPEPQVGDLVEISYNGMILESYPAQLGEVYQITVIEEAPEDAAQANQDTDAIIERLLREICSDEPGSSSNPWDYIEEHQFEYQGLCDYGEFTIRYFLKRFEAGNETGLEGQVMAAVCEELLDLRGKLPADTANGQEWYEALPSNVVEEYLGQNALP